MTPEATEPKAVRECDVLVIGAGAAGFAAAVTAARKGLKVIIAEKASYFGGTSAVSGGWVWVPCSAQARAAGVDDDLDKARTYLRGEMGQRYSAAHVDAYLETAPQALEFFARESDLEFELGPLYADYHPEAPGGVAGGRALVALPYDGRRLGREIRRLKPPVPETTFLGMAVGSGKELKHFFNVRRSAVSAAYVAMLLARFLCDKLFYGRGMRLTNGNALVARLARTAFASGVELRTEAPVRRLLGDRSGVTGALLAESSGDVEIQARHGVILAAGGFAHDTEMRKRLYPHVKAGSSHSSAVDPHVTGDTFRLVRDIGGEIIDDYANAAAWVPLSLVPRSGGGSGPFPHFIDRAKPGVIAVTRAGNRFVNEAVSYHDFVQALQAATPKGGEASCWLIADHPTIRKYGLGHVKPFPVPLRSALRSGYLKRGATLAELATTCDIEPVALEAAVRRYNATAEKGDDPEFGRGSTAYNRFLGDATRTPNPCVGPIQQGPFYAVRLVAGDLGTFAGIRTDEAARVLTSTGEAIPGLYAAGNDAASIMAGTYPGAGITLGPAITFGYIAALRAAEAKSAVAS
ncbi:FAD-dependent oxidoreductase [Bradyrhizobium sp.]|uniref:FAD-dependent oxidoreductase n=1 Tax=Bradyrhizobium sp. TaxID=376 RepID=UPI0039E4545B